MTEEYKKNLLNLISGKAQDAILGSDGSENQLLITDYDYSGILPTGAINLGLYGILDAPENLGNKSVLYGEYQLDTSWYGIVILIDENQTPIDVLTEFDSGTKLRPIQKMIMDDTGNIYAVDGTLPGSLNYSNYTTQFGYEDYQTETIRFLMLNNFTIETNGGYEIKLRRAYNITGQVSVNGLQFFCRDMSKDPNSSNFILVGSTVNTNSVMQVIHLVVNVGTANEWTLYSQTTGNFRLYAGSNVDWNGGSPDFIGFSLIANDSRVAKCTLGSSNNIVETDLYTLPYEITSITALRPFSSYKFFSNNLGYLVVFHATFLDNLNHWCIYCFKYENGSLTLLYQELSPSSDDYIPAVVYVLGEIDNVKWLRYTFSDNTYSEALVLKNKALSDTWQTGAYTFPSGSWEGYLEFDETAITDFPLPTYSLLNTRKILYLLATQKINYNLSYCFLFISSLPTTSYGSYNLVTSMYVENGYSGSYPTYNLQDTFLNSLVPSQAIATHEEGQEVVTDFARNIYNIQIDDNITTSSVEVPYNYLNSEGNQIALYSKTNLPMTSEYTMVKNRYEIVDVNFVNSISVINNNDNVGIYNQDAANKINRSVTIGADYTYYLGKILINYTDNTQRVENIEVEIDDDTHAHAVVLVYVDKAINSIEFVDESTQFIEGGSTLVKGFTYQTIDGSSLEVGKFYNITQPFHIE